MPTLQDYLKQYAQLDAELGAARGFVAPDLSTMRPVAVQTPKKDGGGFVPAFKQAVGAGIKGAGQLAADYVPGVGLQNALQQYGQSVIEANPTAIRSLEDVAAKPGTAVKEATGNAASSVAQMVGLRALGQGITAAAPLTGPLFAPVTAGIGQAISWLGPAATAMLPSYGGIRERQLQKGTDTTTDRIKALVGSSIVAGIETKIGPESWALAAMSKDARKALVAKFATTGSVIGSVAKAAARGAAVEGAEELVQNPIEQMAAGDNPLSKESINDTLLGGVMGALGGGTVGSVFGLVREKAPNTVSDDDLKGAVDTTLAPVAEPVAPMQAEWDEMLRQKQAQNDILAGRNAAEQSVTTPFAAQAAQNDVQIQNTLAADAKALLDQTPTEDLVRSLQTVERRVARGLPVENAVATMGLLRDALESRGIPQAPAQQVGQAALFDESGRVTPEVMVSERAQRAPVVPVDEVISRLQEAQTPRTGGQAALLAGQTPTPSSIVTARGGTKVALPEATLKGFPKVAKAELSKYLSDPAQLAEAVADMFYTKAGQGSSAAYVLDKLPALYAQLTGTPLPETPPVSRGIVPAALPFELQGETPEQASAAYRRQQELSAAETPLPDVGTPVGQASFLTPVRGQIKTAQPPLSRQEQARQRMALKRAQERLGTNIPEVQNAIQERSAEGLDVRQLTQAGQEVAARDTQGDAVAEESQGQPQGQPQGQVNGDQQRLVGQGGGVGSDNLTASAGTQGVEQGRASRGVSGRTAASSTSNIAPVAVGGTSSEQTASVDFTRKGFNKARTAYQATKTGAQHAQERVQHLTDIAQVVLNGPNAQTRRAAREYLEGDEVNPGEAQQALENAHAQISTKFSIGAPQTGVSTEAAHTAVKRLFASSQAFSKRVAVVRNEQDLPVRVRSMLHKSAIGSINGFVSSIDGKVYLLADRLADEREVMAVALHELGVHVGMRDLLGVDTFGKLVAQLEKWSTTGTGVEGMLAARALQRVTEAELTAPQAPDPERLNEEMVAYFVEEAVKAGIDPTMVSAQSVPLRQWFERFWRAIQASLRRLGVLPDALTARDVVDLAYGAAHLQLGQTEEIELTAPMYSIRQSAERISSSSTNKILSNFGTLTDAAGDIRQKFEQANISKLGIKVFKTGLSWVSKHHMQTQFDAKLNGGVALNTRADEIQEATAARFNQMFNEPYHRFEELERTDPARADMLGQLMRATEFKLDPRKSWEAHTHLQNLTGKELETTKEYFAQYRQIWGRLSNDEKQLYDDLASMNQTLYTAQMALRLYEVVRANPGAQNLPDFATDPTEQFRQSTHLHGSIPAAQTYWRGVLDTYTAAVDKFTSEQRGLLPKVDEADPEYQKALKTTLKGIADDRVKQRVRAALRTQASNKLNEAQQKMLRHLSPLEDQLRQIDTTLETFKQAPYFHLGRFGDYYVSFRVRADDSGDADATAMTHVQQVLDEQFPDITIRADATDPHVFARFESINESQRFVDVLKDLRKQGWLTQLGTKDKNNKDYGEIERGVREEMIRGYHTAGPKWLERLIESIQAEGYDKATEQQYIAHARALYLDSLPDTASIKVLQHRKNRPGWHSDMLRNYAHRMRVGVGQVAYAAAEPVRIASFSVMKDALARAGRDDTVSQVDLGKLSAVVHELEVRANDQMNMPRTPGLSMLRAINHAYFLGLSPSYVLIQATQLGVLTWPELARKHGYVASAKAIASVTKTALNVMSTVIREGYKQRRIGGAVDMIITADLLKKAGLSDGDAQFVLRLMADGKIDIGNAARQIGRVAEGEDEGTLNKHTAEALRIASSFGYASEITTRLVAALAAKKLYRGQNLHEYAKQVIDESMMNYSTNNIGRMTTKRGIVGAFSPVMFSFMTYQFQLLEKLYREFHDAYVSDPSLSEEERKAKQTESKRFLKAHLSAMLLLAGSLGLPFMTVLARAADSLCEWLSDGYCDSKIGLRNMTADVFGHDIEPLISRGLLSRAVGFDISDRAGEASILPFSQFIADKRKMDDSLKDLAWSSWGAPSSMVANMINGFEKIGQGDWLGGMQAAVPNAVKGPLKAFSMTRDGYVDKAGNKLPMSPGAWSIALQTFGLMPGERADYQQAQFAQNQRASVLGREGTVIRQHLATAIERQDQAEMRQWMEKAQAYEQANPGRSILDSMGSIIQQRARARALSGISGLPLGVPVNDLGARGFTSFLQPQ